MVEAPRGRHRRRPAPDAEETPDVADLLHSSGREPEAPAVERRHEWRAGCPSRPTLRYTVPPEPRPRWGYAANVSADGVCFLAVEPVAVGAALELHVLEGPPACVRVVRVTHCAPTGVGSWRVGCLVRPPFRPDEIASLL
jgi:hypothetical protein